MGSGHVRCSRSEEWTPCVVCMKAYLRVSSQVPDNLYPITSCTKDLQGIYKEFQISGFPPPPPPPPQTRGLVPKVFFFFTRVNAWVQHTPSLSVIISYHGQIMFTIQSWLAWVSGEIHFQNS